MNETEKADAQVEQDQVVAKVPDLEHVIFLGQAARRRGLEVLVTGQAGKTMVLRGAGREISQALAETRYLGLKIGVARLRSLIEVLEKAALGVPPGLVAALGRAEARLAAANAECATGGNRTGASADWRNVK